MMRGIRRTRNNRSVELQARSQPLPRTSEPADGKLGPTSVVGSLLHQARRSIGPDLRKASISADEDDAGVFFDSEWKGASMLQLAGERIYSIESVHELSEKFRNAKVVLAEFSAPDANKLRLVVSVKRVRQVIHSDPVIFHEKARSVLVFPGKLRLAVRETPEKARQKLSAETKVA
jgi:hypothetical protein